MRCSMGFEWEKGELPLSFEHQRQQQITHFLALSQERPLTAEEEDWLVRVLGFKLEEKPKPSPNQ